MVKINFIVLFFMCPRNLFVLDFTRRFFVRCVQIFEAYAVRTLIKFERGWRKIGRKSKCRKAPRVHVILFLFSPFLYRTQGQQKNSRPVSCIGNQTAVYFTLL